MSGGAIFILVLLVLFLVWLMLVRPQRRRQMAQQAMIDHLQVGDEVLTAGGIFATVVGIDEDEVTVELSPGVEARVDKRAIAAVMPDEEPLEPEPQAEDPEPQKEPEAGAAAANRRKAPLS
jgi:preprotein translocase subunit YajC